MSSWGRVNFSWICKLINVFMSLGSIPHFIFYISIWLISVFNAHSTSRSLLCHHFRCAISGMRKTLMDENVSTLTFFFDGWEWTLIITSSILMDENVDNVGNLTFFYGDREWTLMASSTLMDKNVDIVNLTFFDLFSIFCLSQRASSSCPMRTSLLIISFLSSSSL